MRFKILSVLLAVSLASTAANATPENSTAIQSQQSQVSITGTVVDANGVPITGAVIVEKGYPKNGTITDLDGNFAISVHSSKAMLEVSFIGYEAQTVAAQKGMQIMLKEQADLLDEVIVVAFGKQKREAFTGSAGVINSAKISERQVENALVALNGQVAGVQMVEGNGPGSEPTIQIRGIGSINASTAPLIILDGVPYNGYYSDINPADIESITVQKEAASNALYGARGANGVIMITTKSAKRGKATISFDARWGANTDAKVDYDKITNTGQYYQAHYTALYNYLRNSQGQDAFTAWQNANNMLGGSSDAGGVAYLSMSVPEGEYLIGQNGLLNPHARMGNYVTGRDGSQYYITPDDWKKEGLRTGVRQEYNMNINGGNDQFDTMLSMGYLKNEGVAHNNYYDRYSARLKMNYQARPWLRLGVNSSYTHNKSNGLNDSFGVVHDIAPIYPVYIRDAQGNILHDAHGPRYDYGDGVVIGLVRALYNSANCVQEDKETIYNNNSNAFGVSGYADISFLNDFKFTVNASVNDTENRMVSTSYPYYGFYASTGGGSSIGHYRTFDFNSQQLLNWNHSYGKHNISALAGHEYYRASSTGVDGSKTMFYDYATNVELGGLLTTNTADSYTSVYNVEGYFARALYDYDSRYYANASFRRDGSSRFSKNYRWGNFWSLGGAWIISKESFMQSTKNWLDMLKLKVSYGEQGNDGIGSYAYTDNYAYASAGGHAAYTFTSLGKEDITWETGGEFNVGLEFELFKRRITGGVDYYSRKTTDMLLWVYLPLSYGSSGYYDNVGDMVNRGVELSLNADIIRTKNVTWSINMNISHNTNEVTYLNEDNKGRVMDGHAGFNSGTKFIGEGLPLNTWRLKRYAGADPATGLSTWYVTNSDGTQGTTTSWDSASYYLCGDANAKAFGGFGTNLNAYGLDFTCNFVYALGGKVYDSGYANLMTCPYSGWTGYSYHKDVLNAWSAENPVCDIPRWQYGDQTTASTSDRFLTSGSYLTLKNISLGYTLPKKWIAPLTLSRVRIYCSADNVAYWTARKGFDPRNSLKGSSSGGGYSPIRSISGGISVSF